MSTSSSKPHFCDCKDLVCPLNPNNPKNCDKKIGCDGCVKKNLVQGEIPSCFFNRIERVGQEWKDFSVEGFIRYCKLHGVGE